MFSAPAMCQTPCLTQGKQWWILVNMVPALHLPISHGLSAQAWGGVLTSAGWSVTESRQMGHWDEWFWKRFLNLIELWTCTWFLLRLEKEPGVRGSKAQSSNWQVPGVLGDKGRSRRQGLGRQTQGFCNCKLLSVQLNSTNTCCLSVDWEGCRQH